MIIEYGVTASGLLAIAVAVIIVALVTRKADKDAERHSEELEIMSGYLEETRKDYMNLLHDRLNLGAGINRIADATDELVRLVKEQRTGEERGDE